MVDKCSFCNSDSVYSVSFMDEGFVKEAFFCEDHTLIYSFEEEKETVDEDVGDCEQYS